MTQKNRKMRQLLPIAGMVCALGTTATSVSAETLKFFNWSDYIAEDTIAKFTEATGIEVNYDVYDSNEVLEAKIASSDTIPSSCSNTLCFTFIFSTIASITIPHGAKSATFVEYEILF